MICLVFTEWNGKVAYGVAGVCFPFCFLRLRYERRRVSWMDGMMDGNGVTDLHIPASLLGFLVSLPAAAWPLGWAATRSYDEGKEEDALLGFD